MTSKTSRKPPAYYQRKGYDQAIFNAAGCKAALAVGAALTVGVISDRSGSENRSDHLRVTLSGRRCSPRWPGALSAFRIIEPDLGAR